MFKKFLNNSLIYAGSALLFSIGRQIIFFPMLHKLSPELFEEISFLIILIDFLVYSLGASIADYYVKYVSSKNKNLQLYKFLFYFSYISLSSIIIFLYYGIGFLLSLLLSLYMLFYVFNTLQMKLYFNNLNFKKNYLYISLRLLPYFLLLFYEYYIGIDSFLLFVLLLLFFEVVSFYLFKKELFQVYQNITTLPYSWDKNIFTFIVIYLLFALILRLDMFVVKHYFPDKFSEYYQMISIYMIFVNPIILLTSASLLSILTHVKLKDFIENKYKIISIILGVSFFSGILFQIFGEYMISFLYPNNNLIIIYPYFSFIVIFTTLSFQISKTFIIKYVFIQNIFWINFLILVLSLVFRENFLFFILSFYSLRGIIYVLYLVLLRERFCHS